MQHKLAVGWLLLRLARRSLWRHTRRTVITLLAIALGLSLGIFMLALGDGVYAQMTRDALRMQAGHIVLEHPEYRDAPAVDLAVSNLPQWQAALNKISGVEQIKPLILGQGVARSGRGAVGVGVIGVDPTVEADTSPLAQKLVAGRYLNENDHRAVIMGAKLAKQLKVDVGRKVVITTNDASGALVEELVRVKGIYSVGVEEIDGHVIQIPIKFARPLYGLQVHQATQVGVVLADGVPRELVHAQVQAHAEGLAAAQAAVDARDTSRAAQRGEQDQQAGEPADEGMTGPAVVPPAVRPWEEVFPDLAAYIRMDGASNLIFQGIIIFMSLFTIFNTLLMSVLERRREFAMLMALGTRPKMLQRQVLLEAVLLAGLGCAIGLGVGWGISAWIADVGIDLANLMDENLSVSGFAVDPVMRAHIIWSKGLAVGAGVFVATLLMAAWTVRRIRNIPINEVIR